MEYIFGVKRICEVTSTGRVVPGLFFSPRRLMFFNSPPLTLSSDWYGKVMSFCARSGNSAQKTKSLRDSLGMVSSPGWSWARRGRATVCLWFFITGGSLAHIRQALTSDSLSQSCVGPIWNFGLKNGLGLYVNGSEAI